MTTKEAPWGRSRPTAGRNSPDTSGRRAGKRAARSKPRKPRPARIMDAKTLDRFLTVVRQWKEGMEEPVVGRIRKRTVDPFAVLVGTILSLRTRDVMTEKAFNRLWRLADNPRALAELDETTLAGAIRPVGFYRTKARSLREVARLILERHGGRVPADLDALLALPGVGRKTANLVLTEGYGKPGICVDTHVHRILNQRWGFVRTRTPDETEQVLRKKLPPRWWIPVNGLLVSFGQQVCRPIGPRCPSCPLRDECPYPAKKLP